MKKPMTDRTNGHKIIQLVVLPVSVNMMDKNKFGKRMPFTNFALSRVGTKFYMTIIRMSYRFSDSNFLKLPTDLSLRTTHYFGYLILFFSLSVKFFGGFSANFLFWLCSTLARAKLPNTIIFKAAEYFTALQADAFLGTINFIPRNLGLFNRLFTHMKGV